MPRPPMKGSPGYREKEIHEFSVTFTKRERFEDEEPTFTAELLATSEHAAWSQATIQFFKDHPDERLDDYDIVVSKDYQEALV